MEFKLYYKLLYNKKNYNAAHFRAKFPIKEHVYLNGKIFGLAVQF